MPVTRREFFKLIGTIGAAGSAASLLSFNGCSRVKNAIKGVKKFHSVCPLCSMGCGIVLHTRKGIPVYVEGDASHPVNKGSLCAKGFSLISLYRDAKRVGEVKYRKPNSSSWETLSKDKALSMIADRIKTARDTSFTQFEGSLTVNRTEGIAALAGSSLTNEEAYLFAKFCRLLGVPHIASEYLLRQDLSHKAVSSSFGLHGNTNPWPDLSNAKTIMIIGANPARNNPVVMRHILDAKERGAKVILADPVKTESASVSDIYCHIAPGTDSAFLLGIINYAMSKGLVNREYCTEYTDASYLMKAESIATVSEGGKIFDSAYDYDERGNPRRDDELRSVKTVYKNLKESVSKYTLKYVSDVTGCSADAFVAAAETFASTSRRDFAGAIIYGSGLSSQAESHAVRALSVLQLLLGNIGVSGGGIYRNERGANGLGVSYQIPSWDKLPGGVPLPSKRGALEDSDFNRYLKNNSPVSNDPMSVNQWQNLKHYLVSQLKSWYGETASSATKFDFDWLPKGISDFSAADWFTSMSTGKFKGALFLGADLYSYGLSSNKIRSSLSGLDWLVLSDSFHNDTSDFWSADPARTKTEVFLIPSCMLCEKTGSVTSSDRWTRWIDSAAKPDGESIPEIQFIDRLFHTVKKVYSSGGVLPEPIQNANWNYEDSVPEKVLYEMSGHNLSKNSAIESPSELMSDGSTICGNMLYCGISGDGNLSERSARFKGNTLAGIYPRWGWSVPSNVRILYNRAGLSRNGTPFLEETAVASADGSFKSSDAIHGNGGAAEKNPFILNHEGVGHLIASEFDDGGTPVYAQKKNLRIESASRLPYSPAVAILSGISQYNFLKNSKLARELMLSGICEMGPGYASARRIKTGDRVRVSSAGGNAIFTALVSPRIASSVPEIVVLRGIDAKNLSALSYDLKTVPVDISVTADKGVKAK